MIPIIQTVSFKRTDATKCCIVAFGLKLSYMSSRAPRTSFCSGPLVSINTLGPKSSGYTAKFQKPGSGCSLENLHTEKLLLENKRFPT